MAININGIMGKLKEYVQSPEGREKISKARGEAFAQGKSFGSGGVKGAIGGSGSGGGGGITSLEDMEAVAQMLFDRLYSWAPRSIQPILNQIEDTGDFISRPYTSGDGVYAVDINFDSFAAYGLIRRESLLVENSSEKYGGGNSYTGEGIDNIIALFNNGMDIPKDKGVPAGLWLSHNISVRATTHRDTLHFMQQAVNEFKSTLGDKYQINDIQLNDIYALEPGAYKTYLHN